ncbi:MAG: AMP-binding protein [Deltaproteobacteria bacterium]|nr:AMP-binding protein [Deltaproteobacteria bacterium]
MMKAKIEAQNPNANLKDYDLAYKAFSWKEEEKYFSWHKTGKINIVYEAIDRWTEDPEKRNKEALIFEKFGQTQIFTYQDLKEQSSQFANLMIEHGIETGDRLFIFLPPSPEIYIAMLACARLGVIFSPLYSTFNYTELEVRLRNGEPRVVLTHPDLAEMLPKDAMEGVEYVYLTEGPALEVFSREVVLKDHLQRFERDCSPRWFPADTPLYLIYTSGAGGPPSGVVHAHRDMIGHMMTGRDVLDLTEDSVLWTDGDPAWITGTVYSVFCPWICCVTSVVQGDPYLASTWYRTLERHKISVWYLVEAGEDLPERYDLSALRHIAVGGRSLLPELFFWVKKNLKLTPHENWWMAETGMICLAAFPSMAVKPGSMGKPVPGVEAAIIDDDGEILPILTMGELAFKVDIPSMMTGIWRNLRRYRKFFRFKGWFVTGDLAVRDEDGYFFHQGRNDDLVKIGDKLVGPFEVEQVLCRHPAVEEAAVISKMARPVQPYIKAFITVEKGFTPSARLNQEIKEFVKANLSSEIPLLEITFLKALPKTRNGKILRRVLRARELGLPTGDPSNMQD